MKCRVIVRQERRLMQDLMSRSEEMHFIQVEKREFQHEVHILTAIRKSNVLLNVLLGIHFRSQFARYSPRRTNLVNHIVIFERVKC